MAFDIYLLYWYGHFYFILNLLMQTRTLIYVIHVSTLPDRCNNTRDKTFLLETTISCLSIWQTFLWVQSVPLAVGFHCMVNCIISSFTETLEIFQMFSLFSYFFYKVCLLFWINFKHFYRQMTSATGRRYNLYFGLYSVTVCQFCRLLLCN